MKVQKRTEWLSGGKKVGETTIEVGDEEGRNAETSAESEDGSAFKLCLKCELAAAAA